MIASLRGTLAEKGISDAVIEVGGVGYRVHFSLLTLTRLPEEGQLAKIRVRTVVREGQAIELYGFLSRLEEELFLLLTSVSHVGPKLAITVLSGLEPAELALAIARGEIARLTRIHGVGKKTAERLVVELKDKVQPLSLEAKAQGPAPGEWTTRNDLISALVNLGYKPAQAEQAATAAAEQAGAQAAFEILFREALKGLRSGA